MTEYCALSDIRPHKAPSIFLKDLLNGVKNRVAAHLATPCDDVAISGVAMSTADIRPGDLFVAVKGFRTHGAVFAPKAERLGASAIVTDAEGANSLAGALSIPIVIVDDPRQAAGWLAAHVYGNPSHRLPVAGITGTNGKTTTAFMLRAMLSDDIERVGLSGTVETRIGSQCSLSVATTVEAPVIHRLLATAVEEHLEAAVLEASSHAFDLHRLQGVHFAVSAFTNLTPEHLDFHKDMAGYYNAKRQIMTSQYSDRGVVCVDTPWGRQLAEDAEIPVETVSVMEDVEADWRTHDVAIDTRDLLTRIDLRAPDGTRYCLKTPILGHFIAQDAVVAFICALRMGVSPTDAIRRLESLDSIPGRMYLAGGIKKGLPLAVNDFAHTPEAVESLLKEVRAFTDGKVHAVIACDGERDASHRPRTGAIAASLADTVWVTDCNPRTENPADIRAAIIEGIKTVRPNLEGVTEVSTWRTDAVREALFAAAPGDAVVFIAKGAESYQDIGGVKHAYNETAVIHEVLAVMEQRLT